MIPMGQGKILLPRDPAQSVPGAFPHPLPPLVVLPDVPEHSRRDSRDLGAQGGRASAPTGISTPREAPQASTNFAAVTSQVLVAVL